MRGTPKTLLQAITNASLEPNHRINEKIKDSVEDFLAQKFQTAILKARFSYEATVIVGELWDAIKGDGYEK